MQKASEFELKMIAACLWVGFGLVAPQSATGAESIDGHRFKSLCLVSESDYQGESRFAECERFIADVRSKLTFGTIHDIRACIPEAVPDIQLLTAGLSKLQNESTLHEREAHAVLAEIFASRWPCPD